MSTFVFVVGAALLITLTVPAPQRSSSTVRHFMHMTGHPHGWRGHVVDHVVPLARGGCDCVENMQWQTRREAKRKDSFELWVPPEVLIKHYGKGRMAKGKH